MIIIWGFKRYVERLAIVTLVCAGCQNPAAHGLRRLVTKFTLFFVPLFPVRTQHLLECTFCGATSRVPKDQLAGFLAQAQPPAAPQSPPTPPVPGGLPQL
nr:zinc-ribbon domain-containing protein [Carbonactinospora thermoautotrophica]